MLQAAESNSFMFFSTSMCQPHFLQNFSAVADTKDISNIPILLTRIENAKVMACADTEDKNVCENGRRRGEKKNFHSGLPLLSRSVFLLSRLLFEAPHNAK